MLRSKIPRNLYIMKQMVLPAKNKTVQLYFLKLKRKRHQICNLETHKLKWSLSNNKHQVCIVNSCRNIIKKHLVNIWDKRINFCLKGSGTSFMMHQIRIRNLNWIHFSTESKQKRKIGLLLKRVRMIKTLLKTISLNFKSQMKI